MPELSEETAALLQYLLPGLLAAWVFYGLTSHIKPSQFERIIQALIFTFLVQVFLPIVRWPLEFVGNWLPIRPWDSAAETMASAFVAAALGISLAMLTNKDSFHKWLRAMGFTTRASFPSEWYGVFSEDAENPRFVVLHLTDERRLSGYPKIWPSQSDKGHFYIVEPHWLSDTGELIAVNGIDGLLIATKDVKWVEFISQPKE